MEQRHRSTPTTPPAKEEFNYGDGPYYEELYQEQTLANQCCAEFFGTFTVVLIGVGAECVVLYLGGNTSSASSLASSSSSFGIACAWAIGSTLGIYISGPISGGHVNPAVSLSFALVRPTAFPFSKIIPYWISQILGGILAGLVNLMLFHQAIQNFENSLYPVSLTVRGGGGKNKNISIKTIVPSSFLNLFTATDGKDGSCCLKSASAFGNYWR
jgi:glycerol uptake facilitator-like aquaporin